MKSAKPFQYLLLVFISLGFMVTVTNAQSRYKHLPRVKIQKQETVTIHTNEGVSSSVTPTVVNKQETTTMVNAEVSQPVTTEVVPVIIENQAPQVKKTKVTTKVSSTEQTMVEKVTYVHRTREHKRLGKPEETKKTNMSIAVILLIVFYILAAICTVLTIIFALVTFNYTLFLLFLILAIVFGLAGGILSFLLKFGVIG